MNMFYKSHHKILIQYQLFSMAPFGSVLLTRCISCITICIIFGIFVSATFVYNIFRKVTLSAIVAVFVFVALLVAHIVIVLQSYIMRDHLIEIQKNIYKIDKCFGQQRIGLPMDYSKLNIKYYLMTYGILLLLFSFTFVHVVVKYYYSDPFLTLFVVHALYSRISLRARCLQILFYVYLLCERLQIIRAKLQKMLIIQENCEMQQTISIATFQIPITSIQYCDYSELLALKQIYGKIWSTNCLVNEYFGWSLLAIIVQFSLDLICDGYWMYLSLNDTISHYHIIDSLRIIIPIIFLLFYMCYSCSNCTNQVYTNINYL